MRLPVEAPRVSRADCSSATISAVGEVCPGLLVDMSRGSRTDLSPTIYSLPLLRASDSTRHRILSAQIGSRGHLQNRSPQRRAMWFRSRYVSAFGDETLINPFVLGAVTAGSCGHLGLGGSWLGARGCGSSDRVFSGRSCQVEFSLQSRLLRSCQALSRQPATRVRRGMPASIGTLLASRRGLDDQWLAGRSLTRRSSCAFAATIMVDALIATAPTLMGRSNPQRTSRPPAIGMETRL